METEKLQEGNLIPKKIAAMEVIKELKKMLNFVVVAIIGFAIVAITEGSSRMIGLALILGLSSAFGIYAYKKKDNLEIKYNLKSIPKNE